MDLSVKLALLFALPVCLAVFGSGPSAMKLISSDGYPLEIYHVTTEDGYILELHRIPGGRNETNQSYKTDGSREKNKKVVFFAHCLFCSSSAFVALGPTRGLAYMVANAGYDVWLMNGRGTRHSQRHVKLSQNSDEFWKFSWHEHGIYDVPTSIDFVLKKTGEKQVDYIGYSMGTTMFFAFMSEKPEYSAKIRSMIGLAPIAYLSNAPGVLLGLSPITDFFAKFFSNIRRLNFPPSEIRVNEKVSFICDRKNEFLFRSLCDKLLFFISAEGANLERRMLPFFFSIFPGTTSVRTVIHFAQMRNSAKFEKYNFGRRKNLVNYGSITPPPYNLSASTPPVSLFWGSHDGWSSALDVKRLMSELPNLEYSKMIPSYNHFDFIWAKNAHSKVYAAVVERLKSTEASYCCQSSS